ncbi:MAG: thioether cross-link-forming SCIFF peptide maturase [Clostridia bacterium]|nr:thioether cross-link-forming SCIFF peptide maturase [Clostridia bacterium]
MVHTFTFHYKSKPFHFLWDIESGSLHHVDYAAFLCAKERFGLEKNEKEQADYTAIPIVEKNEIMTELDTLVAEGSLDAPHPLQKFHKNTALVKALCLHICHDCNMCCDYCFASGGTYNTAKDYMSYETGRQAIDFLLKNSGARHNLEVDFFGGEPLLNFEVVKQIVTYSQKRAAQLGKEILFTLTTNCLGLNQDIINYLNENMENVVLSVDGRKETHNGVRHSKSGKDVYDKILQSVKDFRKVRGNKKYYVRGTFTADNLDFADDIFYLNDQGFDQISLEPVVLPLDHPLAITEAHVETICKEYERLAEGYIDRRKTEKWFNFFHFMMDLEHGPCINKRLTGCGAGTEYLAVSPTGDLYPCHQFVGEQEYYLGNVVEGILYPEIREKFACTSVLDKEHCKDCPAKYYCGGGCSANAKHFTGSIAGQYKVGCELIRKRLELSLAIACIESLE